MLFFLKELLMLKRIFLLVLSVFIIIILIFFIVQSGKVVRLAIMISPDTNLGYEELKAFQYFLSQSEYKNQSMVRVAFFKPKLEKQDMITALERVKSFRPDILIAGAVSSEIQMIYSELSSLNFPVVLATVSSERFSNKNDNVFRLVPSSNFLSEYSAKYLYEKGYRSVLIARSGINPDYSDSVYEVFAQNFQGSVKYVDYDKVLNEPYDQYDCFFLATGPGETMLLLNGLKKEKGKGYYINSWAFDFLRNNYNGSFMQGINVISDYIADYQSNHTGIIENFTQEYGVKPTFASSVILMLLDFIFDAVNSKNITEFLKQEKKFENTVYGSFYYNGYGDSIPENIFVYSYNNGTVRLTDNIEITKQ